MDKHRILFDDYDAGLKIMLSLDYEDFTTIQSGRIRKRDRSFEKPSFY